MKHSIFLLNSEKGFSISLQHSIKVLLIIACVFPLQYFEFENGKQLRFPAATCVK